MSVQISDGAAGVRCKLGQACAAAVVDFINVCRASAAALECTSVRVRVCQRCRRRGRGFAPEAVVTTAAAAAVV